MTAGGRAAVRPGTVGCSLAEIAVALPLSVCVLALAAALLVKLSTVVSHQVADRSGSLAGLIRVRREVLEARAVLHPTAAPCDWNSPCLLLRNGRGELVLYDVQDGRLVRQVLTAARTDDRQIVVGGVRRLAVHVLGGKPAVVRIGVLTDRGPVVFSVRPLGPGDVEEPR